MITKPQLGMRVKCICAFCCIDRAYVGKIVNIHGDGTVSVIWDDGGGDISANLNNLQDITIEEQRKQHADKYL